VNPKLLEYFLRVAEFGSINKAALDLHISQPALSRHIGALEHQMRVTLLTRTAGGVRLTEAGNLLCERARPLLRQISLLNEELTHHAAGQVALGMPPSWQRMITGPLVKRLAAEFPRVSIRIYEGINNVLREYMTAGLIDAGIVAYNVPSVPHFARLPLVREPLLLVGDRKAGLRAGEPVTLSRLRHTKIVLPGRPNVIRRYIENVLSRHHHPFQIAVEAESLALCLELARQGVGYTVMPYCALHEHPHGSELTWAPIRRLELTWVLVENESRMHSAAVREARRLLIEEVSRRLSRREWSGAVGVPAAQDAGTAAAPARDQRKFRSTGTVQNGAAASAMKTSAQSRPTR
jgi:LysR family nitrogen assimilation transcriptional regulator